MNSIASYTCSYIVTLACRGVFVVDLSKTVIELGISGPFGGVAIAKSSNVGAARVLVLSHMVHDVSLKMVRDYGDRTLQQNNRMSYQSNLTRDDPFRQLEP